MKMKFLPVATVVLVSAPFATRAQGPFNQPAERLRRSQRPAFQSRREIAVPWTCS
jgi:hypothetical protein